MAERRMTSIAVMLSDKLLQLAPKSILLYQYLMLNADDDGLLANARFVMSIVKAKENNMQELIQGGFLLRFESGVVAIVHWRIHNQIRKDRYKPSAYLEERRKIWVLESGHYTLDGGGVPLEELMKPGKPSGNQSATQNRVDKDRTDEDSIGQVSLGDVSICEDSIDKDSPAAPPAQGSSVSLSDHDYLNHVLSLYRSCCQGLAYCDELSEDDKQQILHLKAIGWTPEDFAAYFRQVNKYPYLKGHGEYGWVASITWLTQEDNVRKVKSGRYAPGKNNQKQTHNIMQPSGELGKAELEAIQKLLRTG